MLAGWGESAKKQKRREAKKTMLCVDFENLLTDYIEGVVGPETNRLMGEHAMKCPVCHETLSAVRSAVEACRMATVPAPSRELEARILQKTVPETAMGCEEFEECLTDYLDGFLPAHLYHRWERHAAMCDRCTELPGEVVRAIGACYTYISEESPLPRFERENPAGDSGNCNAAGDQSSLESARGVSVPLVVRPDHLAATRYGSHDAFGSDAGAYQHCFGGWFD